MIVATACGGCRAATGRRELEFDLPAGRIATEPAEVRGAGRDDVLLMVATRHDGAVAHDRFSAIADLLRPGDLLVVNVSATLAAALPATRDDRTTLRLHLSTHLSGDVWSVELRERAGAGSLPWDGARAGERFTLPGGGRAELLAPYPPGSSARSRLWTAALRLPVPLDRFLDAHGQPIT